MTFINEWLEALKHSNYRGLIIIDDQSFQNNFELIEILEQNLGPAFKPETKIAPKRLSSLLGTEYHLIIYQCQEAFDTNTFCAINGLVPGGGILVLVTSTNQIARKSQEEYDDDVFVSPLLSSFLEKTKDLATTLIWNKNELTFKNLVTDETTHSLEEQSEALTGIQRVSSGHARRPLVLTADRGRGKSAALGIAAIEQIKNKPINIIITAPVLSAVSSAFKHAELTAIESDLHIKKELSKNGTIKAIQIENGGSLKFIPLDKIHENKINCHTLYIDEAAAIPVHQLSKITKAFNRIVFSSTIHGYEGNGQGFETRFKRMLVDEFPQTKFIHLNIPIRWASNDPLERAMFDAFLLNVELPHINKTRINNSNPTIREVSKSELIDNPPFLKTVFALLVTAHYQTRPNDLNTLLTDPKIKLFVLENQDELLGVCMVSGENSLSLEDANQIADRKLSLPDCLLIQSLVSHYGLSEFAQLNVARVMRIAIHPDIQGKGFGSQFIKQIQSLVSKKFEILGASFSATPDVLSFWQHNGFRSALVGQNKDSASGAHTIQVLKPLQPKAHDIVSKLISRFQAQMTVSFGKTYFNFSPHLAFLILKEFAQEFSHALSQPECVEIRRFCEGKRAFLQVVDLLHDSYFQYLQIQNKVDNSISLNEHQFIVSILLLNWNDEQLCEYFELAGKKAILEKLRNIFSSIIGID